MIKGRAFPTRPAVHHDAKQTYRERYVGLASPCREAIPPGRSMDVNAV